MGIEPNPPLSSLPLPPAKQAASNAQCIEDHSKVCEPCSTVFSKISDPPLGERLSGL